VEALESRWAIAQLSARYAAAIDSRDIDAWLELFVPDIDCGDRGRGRAALREVIVPVVSRFYRSQHFVHGPVIELDGRDSASGQVYCRAEHEVGDRHIVVAICYFDRYRRLGGRWFFERRRARYWYLADAGQAPSAQGFSAWPEAGEPTLPHYWPSWSAFWAGVGGPAATFCP
jgi:hypothetical protein